MNVTIPPQMEAMRHAFKAAYSRKTLRELESEQHHIMKQMSHSPSKLNDLKYQVVSSVILEKKQEQGVKSR